MALLQDPIRICNLQDPIWIRKPPSSSHAEVMALVPVYLTHTMRRVDMSQHPTLTMTPMRLAWSREETTLQASTPI